MVHLIMGACHEGRCTAHSNGGGAERESGNPVCSGELCRDIDSCRLISSSPSCAICMLCSPRFMLWLLRLKGSEVGAERLDLIVTHAHLIPQRRNHITLLCLGVHVPRSCDFARKSFARGMIRHGRAPGMALVRRVLLVHKNSRSVVALVVSRLGSRKYARYRPKQYLDALHSAV